MRTGPHFRRVNGNSARGGALLAALLLHAGLAALALLPRFEGASLRGAVTEPPTVALAHIAPEIAPGPELADAPQFRLSDVPLLSMAQPIIAVAPETQSASPAPPISASTASVSTQPQQYAQPAPAPAAAPSILEAYQNTLWQWVAARRPQGIHLEGEATITFTLDRQGRLISASIAQSSGNKLLDRLALRTIRTAAPYPAPPADLPEGALHFSLAFSFH